MSSALDVGDSYGVEDEMRRLFANLPISRRRGQAFFLPLLPSSIHSRTASAQMTTNEIFDKDRR
jgi:hypothetical protein